MSEEKSKLAKYMRKQLGKGAIVGRRSGSAEPFTAWHRDLGQCWHLIVSEAVSSTQAIILEEKKKDVKEAKMEALDTITKMLLAIYADSIKNSLDGITKFGELYRYLEDTKGAKEVYATISGFVVQTFFTYMFTSMEMAIGLPQSLDEEVFDYSSVMNILGLLKTKTRKIVMKELMEAGSMPTAIDYSKLLKATEPFLEVIREDQQRQYEQIRKREAACQKKKQ